MQRKYLIAVDDFCVKHNIEISFVSSLEQTGMIEITIVENKWFISAEQLRQLEKFIRFYYELDINLEGIETIFHLLNRVESMQDEIIELKNKLRLYE